MSVIPDLWSKLLEKAKENVIALLLAAVTVLAGTAIATFRHFTDSYVTAVVVAQLKEQDSAISKAFAEASLRSLSSNEDVVRKQVEDIASGVLKHESVSEVGLWTSGMVLLTASQPTHDFLVFVPDKNSHASLFVDTNWHYTQGKNEELKLFVDGQPMPKPIKANGNYRFDLAHLIKTASDDAQAEIVSDAAARPDLGALQELHSIRLGLSNPSKSAVAGVDVRYMAIVQPTIHLDPSAVAAASN